MLLASRKPEAGHVIPKDGKSISILSCSLSLLLYYRVDRNRVQAAQAVPTLEHYIKPLVRCFVLTGGRPVSQLPVHVNV